MIFEDFVFGVSWFAVVERIFGLFLSLIVILSRGLSYPRWARRAVTGGTYCVPSSSSSFPWPGTKMWHCQVTKYLSVLRQTDFSPPTHTHTKTTP